MQGWGGGGSGQVVLIDNGRVNQSKAADALVQVKTTKFGTNVGFNMLLNILGAFSGLGSCGVCHPQMAIFMMPTLLFSNHFMCMHHLG